MANQQALVLNSGTIQRQVVTDTLVVGNGITTSSGNISVSSFTGITNLNDDVFVAAGKDFEFAGGVSNMDLSASSGSFETPTGSSIINGTTTMNGPTTFTAAGTAVDINNDMLVSGQITNTLGIFANGGITIVGNVLQTLGSVSFTANAASDFTTTAGALTLSGFSGTNLQGGGVNALVINSSGTAITVQSGAVLAATGTGNINLPNNGSARFQIEGVAVTANVTSTNLDTLTAGPLSDASGLHTHASFPAAAPQLVITGVTTTGITTGLCAYISAANTLSLTSSSAIASSRIFGWGNGTAGQAIIAGIVTDAAFTTAGGSPTNGDAVFLASSADDGSTGAGKLTATAPVVGVNAEAGIVLDNSNYAGSKTCVILIQVKGPVVI